MTRGGTPLYLVLTNKKELVEDVKLGSSLFSAVPSEGTRGNGHKLEYKKFHLNTQKNAFFFFSFYCEDGQALEQIARKVVESPA